MVETEEYLNYQSNFPKTIETELLEDTIKVTKKNNKNKNNKHLEISITDENNKHTKPKKTKLTKTISSL